MIKRFIFNELRHFNALSVTAQQVLKSFAVFELMYPLIFIFVNAFILRQTQNFAAVAMYNLGTFVMLPCSFYLNGYLLRRFPITTLYTIGLIGQGVMTCLVFFYPFQSLASLLIFGLLQGLPMGVYWANRNFISLEFTDDGNRAYFTGLEMVLTTLAGITTPVIVGWIIRLGDFVHFYTADQAYKVLGVLSVGILFYGGKVLRDINLKQPQCTKLWLGKASSVWKTARVLEVFRGIENGINLFLVPLVIFAFLGKEGSLGTLQSLAAALEVIIMYVLAKYLVPPKRLQTLFKSILLMIGLGVVFMIGFSPLGALIYVILIRTVLHTNWVSSNPMTMKVIDEEEGGDPTNNYVYVCDRETFLNVGRVLGVIVFFGLMSGFSSLVALRFIPVFVAVMQVGLYICAQRLAKGTYGK